MIDTPVYTDPITSKVEVTNQVEGKGVTHTYIETVVNGERQVLETNEPGEYQMELTAETDKNDVNDLTINVQIEADSQLKIDQPVTKTNRLFAFIKKVQVFIESLLSRLF